MVSNVITGVLFMAQMNLAGINLIKSFEALRLDSYQDERGIWTIGYGCTGPDIGPGMQITVEEAESMFQQRLSGFCHALDSLLPDTLTDNQYSAVCSLTYNIGLNAFAGSSLHRKLQAGVRGQSITDEFSRWNHVNGVEDAGLTRRRAAEAQLFNTP